MFFWSKFVILKRLFSCDSFHNFLREDEGNAGVRSKFEEGRREAPKEHRRALRCHSFGKAVHHASVQWGLAGRGCRHLLKARLDHVEGGADDVGEKRAHEAAAKHGAHRRPLQDGKVLRERFFALRVHGQGGGAQEHRANHRRGRPRPQRPRPFRTRHPHDALPHVLVVPPLQLRQAAVRGHAHHGQLCWVAHKGADPPRHATHAELLQKRHLLARLQTFSDLFEEERVDAHSARAISPLP
mmetsp:Transcript_33100/g.65947  ORF Transcript_33100/g.65947 Transcript_33100/m.65947 type:complete len:241 (+) Transcript_33100:163-885(+)